MSRNSTPKAHSYQTAPWTLLFTRVADLELGRTLGVLLVLVLASRPKSGIGGSERLSGQRTGSS